MVSTCPPGFILAGQSNMLGHNIEPRDLPVWLRRRGPTLSSAVLGMGMNSSHCRGWAPYRLEQPQEMFCGEFQKLGLRNTRGGPGPEASFAHAMSGLLPRLQRTAPGRQQPIHILKAALGGSPLLAWEPGKTESNVAWQQLRRMITAAGCVDWLGLVWMQGESEAAGVAQARAVQWGASFAALLAAVRAATGRPHLAAVVGRTVVPVDWRVVPGRPWKSRFVPFERHPSAKAVRAAQQAAGEASVDAAWVDLDDLPRSAGAHFAANEYVTMGLRFGVAMLTTLARQRQTGQEGQAAGPAKDAHAVSARLMQLAPHRNSTIARAFRFERAHWGGTFVGPRGAAAVDPLAPKAAREGGAGGGGVGGRRQRRRLKRRRGHAKID